METGEWIALGFCLTLVTLIILNVVFGWHIRFWAWFGGPGSLTHLGMERNEQVDIEDHVTTWRGAPWGFQLELVITYLDVIATPNFSLGMLSYRFKRLASWSYRYRAALPGDVAAQAPAVLDEALWAMHDAGWPLPVASPGDLKCTDGGVSFEFPEERWGRAAGRIEYELQFLSALVETISNLVRQTQPAALPTHKNTRRQARKLKKDLVNLRALKKQ